MSIISLSDPYDEEPTFGDLVAIEAEWPQIAAELDLLDAEIAALIDGPYMSEIDRRRTRRAERRVLDSRRELADNNTPKSEEAA